MSLPPRSPLLQTPCTVDDVCTKCASDLSFLRSKLRPAQGAGAPALRVADIFSGCGGMSLGLQEAARRLSSRVEIALALDSDPHVVEIYQRNIGGNAQVGDVVALFDGQLGEPLTQTERKLRAAIGSVQVLLGGPPCQGHSDLNNHTRRNDPKNALYLSMVRAAEVLQPAVVVVENVSAVQWDKSQVVQLAKEAFGRLGYSVGAQVLDLWKMGVPQRRRRFVLIASQIPALSPSAVFDSIVADWGDHPARTVRWAIEDLLQVESKCTFDTPSKKSKANAARMAFLFESGRYNLPNDQRPDCHRDGNHSYVSVYGRLRWDRPAQTITTGFGSMGQGRYVHPQRRRTITPHEAARLQAFPDWFDFGENTSRGVLSKAIGNAVPPFLMSRLGARIVEALISTEIHKAAG